MGPILVTLLAMACFRPTEPDFWTEPCPNLSPNERLDPTQAERLEKLPTIPADTPVGIGDFIARVSSLRWVYFPPRFHPRTPGSTGLGGPSGRTSREFA
jgi:hypothetical protein